MKITTMKKLHTLELQDLAKAIERQEMDLSAGSLSFDERLEMILEDVISERERRHMNRLIRNAFLKYPDASIESLDYESRDMTRETIIHLAKMSFVETATNLVVTGPAGAGKTYLACALGVEACKHSYRTFYIRMNDFLRNMENLRDNVREMKKYLRRISNYHVLIMDEWLSHVLSEKEAKNLYELLELRKGVDPTIFAGQYAMGDWYDRLGGGAIAESILDRIVHNAYPIKSSETNLRRKYDEMKLRQFLESMNE